MRFDNCILHESEVVLNITKGKWKIKGIDNVQLISIYCNNKYYNVYYRETKDDSTIYYTFDDKLKLYKIVQRGNISRIVENGVITDILCNNPSYVDIAAEIDEDEEETDRYE